MKVASYSYQGHNPAFKEDILALSEIVNSYFKSNVSIDFFTDNKNHLDKTTALLTDEFFNKTAKSYKAILTDQIYEAHSSYLTGLRLKLFQTMQYDLAVRPVIMYHNSKCLLKGPQVPDIRLYICRETRLRPVSLLRDTYYPGRDFEVINENQIYSTQFMEFVLNLYMDLAQKKRAENVAMVIPVNIKSTIFGKWHVLFEQTAKAKDIPFFVINVREFWKMVTETPQRLRWIFAPDPLGDYLFNSLNYLLNQGFFSCYALLSNENKIYIENYTDRFVGSKEYRSPLNIYHTLAMLYDLTDMVIPARILRRGIFEAMEKGWLTPELGGTMNTSAVSGLYSAYVDKELSENSRTM
jgi:hypothetical protein